MHSKRTSEKNNWLIDLSSTAFAGYLKPRDFFLDSKNFLWGGNKDLNPIN